MANSYLGIDLSQTNILGSEYYKQSYDFYELLTIASEISDQSYFKEAFKIITCIEYMILKNNNVFHSSLVMAIRDNITCNRIKFEYEYGLYEPIKHYIPELIPNATVDNNIAIINRKIPDIFLRINRELIVGEIKPHQITKQHVNQLIMYINTYNTRTGYIFGRELSCNLPNNIIFVNITNINYKYQREVLNIQRNAT